MQEQKDQGDYAYEIGEALVETEDGPATHFFFIVYYRGEEVEKSRNFRLRVQADRKAQDFISGAVGDDKAFGGITLDVQSVITDIGSLFGGKHNG